jgi:hypothetical protein
LRRRHRDGDVPAHLRAFREHDWPGRTWEDRFRFWKEARRVYHEEHGWPGGPVRLIGEQSDVRRSHEGLPLWSWGRTGEELDRIDPRRRGFKGG